MKEKPYIGVTGIKNLNEVRFLDKYFEVADPFSRIDLLTNRLSLGRSPRITGYIDCEKDWQKDRYIAMLGFLSSEKRLKSPDEPGRRSPAANGLNAILEAAGRDSLKMIHYHTKNTDSLADQVSFLFDDKYERLCSSLQLNVKFPPIKEIEKIIQRFPEMKIVYQLSKKMLDIGTTEIAEESSGYDPLVSYALIDPSCGYGREFDSSYYTDLLFALKENMPTTRLGIAGGFDASNVKDRISPISFDEAFSIDSESRLRYADDSGLDPKKVFGYIKNSSYAFLTKDL